MDHGWIKIHRSILSWEWYDDANTFRLFFHCLILANHKTKEWRGIPIERGSFLTSYPKLAEALKLTENQIRYSLNKLKVTGEVTVKVTVKYSMVSICNYERYQVNGELKSHSKSQTKSQFSHSSVTPTKKERTKETKKYSETILQIVRDFYNEKSKLTPMVKSYGFLTDKQKADSCDVIDKLNRIDNIPFDVIRMVVMRSIKDEFWQNQIISLAGLRTISKNKMSKFANAYAKLASDYRPAASEKVLLGFRYKCPSCEDVTVEREYRPADEFDAYTCKVDGCSKVQLVNKEMVGSTLKYIEKVYKEES